MSSVGARDDGTAAPTGLVLVTESLAIIAGKVIDLPLFGHTFEHHRAGLSYSVFISRIKAIPLE